MSSRRKQRASWAATSFSNGYHGPPHRLAKGRRAPERHRVDLLERGLLESSAIDWRKAANAFRKIAHLRTTSHSLAVVSAIFQGSNYVANTSVPGLRMNTSSVLNRVLGSAGGGEVGRAGARWTGKKGDGGGAASCANTAPALPRQPSGSLQPTPLASSQQARPPALASTSYPQKPHARTHAPANPPMPCVGGVCGAGWINSETRAAFTELIGSKVCVKERC